MDPYPLRCLQSWSEELLSRANRVRLLIGDHHWLSDGHHKERILSEFLRRHLPPNLALSPGFVCCPVEKFEISGEVDLLLTDAARSPAFFAESGLSIVPPEAVIAHIHVKSSFRQDTLNDTFKSVKTTYDTIAKSVEPISVWSAVFFFQDSEDLSVDTIVQYCTRACENAALRNAYQLPSCVAVLRKATLLVERRRNRPKSLRAFSGDVAPAIILSEIYGHLAAIPNSDSTRLGIFNLLEKTGITCLQSTNLNLND